MFSTSLRLCCGFLMAGTALAGCALESAAGDSGANSDGVGEAADELVARDAWVRLDSSTGLRNARLSAVNGGKVRCANGASAASCTGTLVLPADCKWECQDNLLGLQGETLLLGKFVGARFVVAAGYDSMARGIGAHSVYVMRASSTCLQDPCPSGITRKKLNSSAAADPIATINFATAADPNFANDAARGYDRILVGPGLPLSGRMQNGAFQVDRVWRLETPLTACDPQLVARAHAYLGGASRLIEYRTVREAESAANVADESRAWMVRSAESPAAAVFTSGINDLWAEKFSIAKADCALTTIAEH